MRNIAPLTVCHSFLTARSTLSRSSRVCYRTIRPRCLQTTNNMTTDVPLVKGEDPLPQTNVLHRKISGARMFILSRAEKLNALNLEMIRNIIPQLKAWDVSTLAKVIVMKGAGSGKFSAGDDVLEVLENAKAKDADALKFFQEKSALVQMISTLTTPYIAVLDGYALGGALGLFAHGPFRIATEKTIFSMPEASLGVFFNSGSSFFLSKLDGQIGTYLALTGSRVEGVDAFFTGIATHYIPSERLGALEERLIDLETSEHEVIQRVLESFVHPIETTRIGFSQHTRETIDRCFGHDTMDEILEALDREQQTPWIRETRKRLLSVSPTALRVTLRALRKGQSMTLCECLEMEFDLMQKFLVTADFHEGVDAMFQSKPRRKPQWSPSSLAAVTDKDVDQLYFCEPSPNTLRLPSLLDFKEYPYSRFGLPTEEDVRQAVTGNGPRSAKDGRLSLRRDLEDWFLKGHRGKWGVSLKVMDVVARKTVDTAEEGLVWK